MTARDQLQQTLCDSLFWHTAQRDEAKIADYLFHQRAMNIVYAMDEATLFDSFFNYLQEIEVLPFLGNLDPKKRNNFDCFQILLVFLMKITGAIKKMDQIVDILLSDELLMAMCGFNAYQVRKGSCARGVKLRKEQPPEIRGSLCVDTVAKHIVTITLPMKSSSLQTCPSTSSKKNSTSHAIPSTPSTAQNHSLLAANGRPD